jgi:PucR C-terminal helix-turn-helix domain
MNRSNPSAAESVSQVSAALVPRAADVAADIYRLIVQEIPALRGDKRVQALLEASVAENVSTMLHILQHGIDLENVRAPAAAEEYARRLAQHGAPVAALLRAYRIGSARFEEWCLQELGRSTESASIVSAAGMLITGTLASYIDLVSEEVFSAYEAEKEKWLRNQSAAQTARVRALLRNEQPDVAASEAILRYRLRDTLRVFLQENGSYKSTAERLVLHKNTVQYRVRKAEESMRRPVVQDRLRIELALLAAQWLGTAVLRSVGGPDLDVVRHPADPGQRGDQQLGRGPLGGVPHDPGQDDVAVRRLCRDANGRGLVQRERVVRRLSQLRVVADVARRQPDL